MKSSDRHVNTNVLQYMYKFEVPMFTILEIHKRTPLEGGKRSLPKSITDIFVQKQIYIVTFICFCTPTNT